MITSGLYLASKLNSFEVKSGFHLKQLNQDPLTIRFENQVFEGAHLYACDHSSNSVALSKTSGSSTALLKHLINMPNFDLNLLRTHFKDIAIPDNQDFDPSMIEYSSLLVSFSEDEYYSISTQDFAATLFEDNIHFCTVSELDSNSRIFFEILSPAPELQKHIQSFMKKPANQIYSNSEQLPSFSGEKLHVSANGEIEEFIEDFEEMPIEHKTREKEQFSSPKIMKPRKSASIPSALTEANYSSSSSSSIATDSASNRPFRQCLNCFCTSTPMWRRGPDGTASLCNACGVKFKKGTLQMDPETVDANLKKIRLETHQLQEY